LVLIIDSLLIIDFSVDLDLVFVCRCAMWSPE